MTDDFKFEDLTEKQKKRLLKFYNVSSLDELTVKPNGHIVGSGKPETRTPRLFLEDHNKKLHELKIDMFLKNQKNPSLGFTNIPKKEAKEKLENIFKMIGSEDLSVFVVEHGDRAEPDTTLFQQLIIFYSNLLKSVLCGNKISEKYITATGNPAVSDVDFYNVYKKDGDVVIKGFAFCNIQKGGLFIDVICGTGGTGDMVRQIFDGLSQLTGKPKYIFLESIETEQAISFYSHLGFKKKDSDTLKLLEKIKKSKEKDFESFARKNPKLAGGLLYLNPPASVKAQWVYTPISWWSSIKNGDSPKLEGEGIGSFFKSAYNKAKETVTNVLGRLKPNVSGFTNQSKAILGKYGKGVVVKLVIIRQPIMGVLDTIINTISFGTFQKAKQKYGYDKLFHLQLAAYVKVGRGVTKIVLEKNETVDMSVSTEHVQTGNKEFLIVPFEKTFTLEHMVNTAREQQGDQRFFEYDAFKNNCQWFISYLLHAEELYGPKEKAFLFQDLTEFTKDLPKWLPEFARKVTDLGATVSNLRGKGRRAAPIGVEAKQTGVYADVSKANQTSQDIIKKLSGGIGVQNYLSKEQREANRRAAEARVASMGPGVRALNSTRLKELSEEAERARNQTIAKPKTKKTIKDYQAEEIYRDAQDAKKRAEEEATAKEAARIEQERQDKENRRLAKIDQLKKSFEETKTQLQNDVTAYREGRIDDIQNNELRSRAQTERNLGFKGDNKKGLSFYQAVEETYKNALRQQKEHDMLMLIPAVMQMGISEIPKVGDAVSSVVDAALDVTNAAKDTSADARRKAIIEAGPPVRPDVLEGFTGEFPEPDWDDLAEKEGYGKPEPETGAPSGLPLRPAAENGTFSGEGLHAIIFKKNIPLEKAKKEAIKYTGPNKKFFRETKHSYRFRNTPKQKFDPKSFRTAILNKDISLVFGKLL